MVKKMIEMEFFFLVLDIFDDFFKLFFVFVFMG